MAAAPTKPAPKTARGVSQAAAFSGELGHDRDYYGCLVDDLIEACQEQHEGASGNGNGNGSVGKGEDIGKARGRGKGKAKDENEGKGDSVAFVRDGMIPCEGQRTVRKRGPHGR